MMDKLKILLGQALIIINIPIACLSILAAGMQFFGLFYEFSFHSGSYISVLDQFAEGCLGLFTIFSLNLASAYIGFDLLKMNEYINEITKLYTKFLKFIPILFLNAAFIEVYIAKHTDALVPPVLFLVSCIVLFRHKINVYFRYLGALLCTTSAIVWFVKLSSIYNILIIYILVISAWGYISYYRRSDLLKTFLYTQTAFFILYEALYIIYECIINIDKLTAKAMGVLIFIGALAIPGLCLMLLGVFLYTMMQKIKKLFDFGEEFYIFIIASIAIILLVQNIVLAYYAVIIVVGWGVSRYMMDSGMDYLLYIIFFTLFTVVVVQGAKDKNLINRFTQKRPEIHAEEVDTQLAKQRCEEHCTRKCSNINKQCQKHNTTDQSCEKLQDIPQSTLRDCTCTKACQSATPTPQVQQQQVPQQSTAPAPQVQQQQAPQQFAAPAPQVQQQQAPQQFAAPAPQVQQQQSQVVCKQGSGAGCSATCYKMYNDCIAQGGGAESCAQSIANIIPANAKPSSNCICPTCNNTWNKRW